MFTEYRIIARRGEQAAAGVVAGRRSELAPEIRMPVGGEIEPDPRLAVARQLPDLRIAGELPDDRRGVQRVHQIAVVHLVNETAPQQRIPEIEQVVAPGRHRRRIVQQLPAQHQRAGGQRDVVVVVPVVL